MSLNPEHTADVLGRLGHANRRFAEWYPGEPATRQPVHTVYGGAQLYKATTTNRLGELALKHLDTYAPDAAAFAAALGLPGDAELHRTVYERTRAKLEREAVEDFRIDFEDGYGNRPDDEEDAEAVRTATELSRAWNQGDAPPFVGIRVKPLTEELKERSVRTLDLFVTTLAQRVGDVPDGFVITLPKVTIPEQVEAFVELLGNLEHVTGMPEGALKIELMIEATQALMDSEGRSALPGLLRAADGRCTGAHLGTYDFTASANITAQYQVMDHPVCDLAKQMMTLAYAQTGIFLSDGATNVMPVGEPEVVHAAWRLQYGHVRHSLEGGYYQGWDLHPGQLPVRYAACYAFFLEGYDAAAERLGNFIDKAAQATLVGDVFDDAATGQGLLNYFLRALNCGAVTLDEVAKTGLTLEEIQGRSFVKILENRRKI